ncbi:TetR/AcrR family transcriptional regulator [Pelagimonas sp. KU-00592-HH]|uniref:TetR/AcrR family transcriptional regulator n=1 Tax=Roseobacteraceae TaxID=2854170 RepID=UPI0020CF2E8A|nr:TetR/AcrR family transcriptional regulator [Shimia sp. CNT1-13L.2]MCP9480467.1 TetR/AcrR family transcriptional regulator [Shimia sp. CNT1-13L.2]
MAQEAADLMTRRRKVLDAARVIFAEEGGLDAGLRKIAAAAGYTTGAIYKMFSGKEDIYAALLEESLHELHKAVSVGAAKEADPEASLRASVLAAIEYYQAHKFEYQLGLYLFEREGRKSLGAERDRELNEILKDSMAVFQACFLRIGGGVMGEDEALERAHATFAAMIGVLALSFSKRDRSLETHWQLVLDSLLGALIVKPSR